MGELNLPEKIINSFVEELTRIYKDGLISVALYGSAASKEFSRRHSNINLLVVLSDAGLANLSRAGKIIRAYKYRNLHPLFLTEGYINSSTDVFPIEFLDMKENHVVLHGKDALGDINIDLKNLRFQCEQELKAKLINIKAFYLRNTDKRALITLLFKSLTSTMHILRNLIRLKGKTPPYSKEEILIEFNKEFKADLSCLFKILDAKKNDRNLSYHQAEELLFNLVDKIEEIVSTVDKF